VEVLFTVEPETSTAPGDLEEILDEIVRRVDRAIGGLFENLPAAVRVEDIGVVNPPHVPFFPATFGDRTYEDQAEVYEAIDKLRGGTPQEGLLFDSAGRAFQVVPWASFRRVKEEDRRIAELWTLDPLEAESAELPEETPPPEAGDAGE
jgi:hypothetical protein